MKKLPIWLLKFIAMFTKLCPKFVLDFRNYVGVRNHINWRQPKNLQEYALTILFNKSTDLDLYARLADKIEVRKFVEDRIGQQYLTILYGTWTNAKEIDFGTLPNRFVLKTNNGCGTNFIIKDKSIIDINRVVNELNYWLKYPYGALTGQIHYSRINPKILAEEYLEQSIEKDSLPYDYKFFCYKGVPRYVLYYEGRSLNGHITPNMLFDMEWNEISEAVNRPINHKVNPPISFEEMKQCVKQLCSGFDFVRVDFYEINGRPVFGEMTFTPDIIANIRSDFNPLMQIFKE